MKPIVLVLFALACASAPSPKRPDESRRVPVNRTVPAEVASEGAPEKPDMSAHQRGGLPAEVEWR